MMNKMVVANLVHRPTRSLIATSAIALEVVMILMVVALFYGLLNGSKESQLGVGADLMVMPPGSSGLVAMSGAPISVKVGNVLRRIPHVVTAAPVVWAFSQKPLEVDYGIDLASYDQLSPAFHYLSGGPFQGPNDAIVDDYYAGMNHKKVGDTVDVLNNAFRICGIVPHGKGGRKFLPLTTMQDLIGADGRASVFYLKLDSPANIEETTKAIQAIPGMEKYAVRSMAEYLSMMTPDNLPGFDLAIKVVIGVAVVGIVAGIVLSAVTRRAIMFEKPVLRLFWSNEWVLRAAVIAVVGALAGALYPALKAAQRDPIDALAYE